MEPEMNQRHPAHYHRRGTSMGSSRYSAQRDADDLERQRRNSERGSMLLLERLISEHGPEDRSDLYVHPASK
jgi:hypothetical protein